MERDKRNTGPARNSSDPERPAYDNPVGNKGELAAGSNAKKPPRRGRHGKPKGHRSDKKLRGLQQ